MNNINNPPMFERAGRVVMKVSTMTYRDFYYFKSLSILAIMKDLIKVVAI